MKTLSDMRAWATVHPKTGCWTAEDRAHKAVSVYAWLPGKSQPSYMLPRRAAWAYAHGALPAPGLIVVATCRTSGCFNPAHACGVTSAEAGRMKRASGTFRNQPTRIAANRAAARKRCALTQAQVLEIQASGETGRAISKRLGLGASTVSRVRRGEHCLCTASPWAMLLPGVKIGPVRAKQC